MFNFIKEKIKKVYQNFTSQISTLFSGNSIDQQFLAELKKILITADMGLPMTTMIMDKLSEIIKHDRLTKPEEIRGHFETILLEALTQQSDKQLSPILLLVGVNGSGKTTFASKLAYYLKQQGKRVLLVAADTFRAAAVQQLAEWAKKIDVTIFTPKNGGDPASVVFDACTEFKNGMYDHVIIDTAGRLQTKVNLMNELKKIKSIITRQLPDIVCQTWLTIDAMLGQNTLMQADLFTEATDVNGIVITKLDGTAKGGTVFAVTHKHRLPITFVSFGENVTDLQPFDRATFVRDLLSK